jgi:DNA-binding protein H-NS
LGELKGLHYDIEKEIESRQLHEVSKAREKILAIAQKLGGSVEDLLGVIKKTKAGKAEKGKARYKNPGDSSKTWSGRGGQPRWRVEGLASGRKLDDFLI